MKENLMMARIRDAEHSQYVAELKQKISLLELKVSGVFSQHCYCFFHSAPFVSQTVLFAE
jgi:hypothetical protein